ncbi:MAG: autoinducer 2 ABC transporter substrate-binding protein, partial [Methylobacteriaceae bacterium]|nr:autoinducer 2 ABC transporter substrate-binding protein [Methylobacteriaceae bacterium]
MNRRDTLKLIGATTIAAAMPGGLAAFADTEKSMTVVVKIAGIPWFNALEQGIKKASKDFSINANM